MDISVRDTQRGKELSLSLSWTGSMIAPATCGGGNLLNVDSERSWFAADQQDNSRIPHCRVCCSGRERARREEGELRERARSEED